jgi:hypothetical protein
MRLYKNMVLATVTDDEADSELYRVLWVSPDNQDVAVIRLNTSKGLPVMREYHEILAELEEGSTCIVESDPLFQRTWVPHELSQQHLQRMEAAWSIIASLVENHVPAIFIKAQRGPLIAEVRDRTGKSEKEIRRLLRTWWQGGQVRAALLPQYHRSGGKGKKREGGDKKLGRWSADDVITGFKRGVVINDEIRHTFDRGLRRFHRDERSLRDVYKLMMTHYFTQVVRNDKTGELKRDVLPRERRPSFRQFYY